MKIRHYFLAWPKTLRGRLTLWYVASTMLTFVVLAGLFSGMLWLTLHDQIDHHIHIVVTEAQHIVEQYSGAERDQLLKNLVNGRGMTVVLLSADGSPILQTNSPDVALMSEHQMQRVLLTSDQNNPANNINDAPIHFSIQNFRFATVRVTISGSPGVLAVGYSQDVIDQTFWNLLFIIALVLVAISLPLSLLGYMLLKKNLQPLETIATTARSITQSQKLETRIAQKQSTAELEAISDAFNQMLSQIQTVFNKEHEFFADAAHTLKTPLAVLRSEVEALPVTMEKDKNILLTKIDSVAEVIQDLLLISRIQTQHSAETDKINLSVLLQEFAELAQVMGSAQQLQIKTDIQPNVMLVGNLQLVKRMLSNLVENAVLYSNKNGQIFVSLKKEMGKATIQISDTGVGIDQADLPHIFERFYRGKTAKKTKGSGLGLAISQAIMESIGGSIAVSSKLGRGTTFTLNFK